MMHKWTIPHPNPITINILLFDRFSNMCLANCLEPLRAANTILGKDIYRWHFLTCDGAAVQSSSSLPITPEMALADMQACDYLFVISAYDYDLHDTSKTRRILRRAADRSRAVVGLDSGSWLMAGAGLLTAKRATIHWEVLDAFSERFLDVDVVRERVVRDGNRITCAGAMSAYDLARNVIENHLGHGIAQDVDALFLRDPSRAGDVRPMDQKSPVERAITLMHENIEKPLDLATLAKHAACPSKTLERRFRAQLGATPGQVYRHIRLTAARNLVVSTTLQVTEIALRCGYESPAALSRAYKARFGHPPRRYSATSPR
jgi:AraC family carnitine catabolism transcriptional activator